MLLMLEKPHCNPAMSGIGRYAAESLAITAIQHPSVAGAVRCHPGYLRVS